MQLFLYWDYAFTFEVRGEDHPDSRTGRFRRYPIFPVQMMIDRQ